MEKVDTVALRMTVRLIHCLQKERGVTCIIATMKRNVDDRYDPPADLSEESDLFTRSGSNDTDLLKRMNNQSREMVLAQYRKNTDSAFTRFTTRVGPPSSFKNALNKIRLMQEKRTLYRAFNALIAHIIHEQVEIPLSCFSIDDNKHRMKTMTSVKSQSLLYDGSHSSTPEHITPGSWSGVSNNAHVRAKNYNSRYNDIGLSLSPQLNIIKNSFKNGESGSNSNNTTEKRNGIGKLIENYDHQFKTLPSKEENAVTHTMASLISLLLAFIKLKESKGIERCSFPGLLRMPNDFYSLSDHDGFKIVDSEHEIQLILSDLVMEMEKQRSLVRNVRKKAILVEEAFGESDHKSFLILTEESLELNPELSKIQDLVRLDFDLKAFRQAITFDNFWNLMTAYMNKLHSIELLIIEEMEAHLGDFCFSENQDQTSKCSKAKEISNTSNSKEPMQILLNTLISSSSKKNTNKTETLYLLQNIPADNIKKCLISVIKSDYIGEEKGDNEDFGNNKIEKDNQAEFSILESDPKQEWEVNLYEVKFQKRIGRGGAGTTYLGKWRGQDVAIKVAAMTEMGIDGWNAEVRSLQQLHHTNIIRLLGSICNPPPQATRCLILEYCDAGDLEHALKKAVPPNFFFHVTQSMANGLSYLHDKNILHRDIKPENVLLHGDVRNGKFVVKLNDFGLSTKLKTNDGKEHSAETGTYRWMAPEVIRHEAYSHQADVYSYSLVVWQLISHENPFENSTQIHAAQLVAMHGYRPPFPEGTPCGVEKIISRGWTEDPRFRPTFGDLCTDLQTLSEQLSDKDSEWLAAPHGHPVYNTDKHIPLDHMLDDKIHNDEKKISYGHYDQSSLITPLPAQQRPSKIKSHMKKMFGMSR